MKKYPKEERIDMIFVLGKCQQNSLLASRVYAQKFPERQHPNKFVFERLLIQFRETGNVEYKKQLRRSQVTGNEENQFNVLRSVIDNPHTSRTEISSNTDIGKRSISRI
ncbi:hypothetical protein ABEB36_013593 [Hypothenemus hampei]|uniref:DUF4817 domain-containing protein n=1 Tax=Hypothenemus hampei TaxID=57062 RepID=A0ABD1E7G1_HYPHA